MGGPAAGQVLLIQAEDSVPTYAYACTKCSHRFDIYQSFSDVSLTTCPECGKEALRKVFSPVGVVFKGSGFYRTDSRSGQNSRSSNGSQKKSGESSTGDKSAAGASSNGSSSSGSSSSGSSSSGSSSSGSSSTSSSQKAASSN